MSVYYLVIHHHRYGASYLIVKSEREPTQDEAAALLTEDYEPDKDEWIEVIVPDMVQRKLGTGGKRKTFKWTRKQEGPQGDGPPYDAATRTGMYDREKGKP